MSSTGVGNLVFIDHTMNHLDYLNILQENLMSSVQKLGMDERKIMFQKDNDPKHCAKKVKEWCIFRIPKQPHTPPQSPDLNPIEHLWDLLDRIRKRKITSKGSLKNVLLKEWEKISSQDTYKLVSSMNRRLKAVVKAKNNQTKY